MTESRVQSDPRPSHGVAGLCFRAQHCRDVDEIRALLTDPPDGTLELVADAQFSPERYTRRVLFQNESVSVLLLGWLPGQASEIHDHGGSACCFRVLQGVAVEARYEPDAHGDAVEVSRDRFLPGSVLGCDGTDIHAITNDPDAPEPLITLHVYRPAPVMRYFKPAPGRGAHR
jgi:predicted metal-dependent enzyme (double-stranded beta helix superfamily)